MSRRRRRPSSAKRARLRAYVIERDGLDCWLCGRTTDPTAPQGADEQTTLDRVVPGGPYRRDNVLIACEFCNMQRGDRPLTDAEWARVRGRLGTTARRPRAERRYALGDLISDSSRDALTDWKADR